MYDACCGPQHGHDGPALHLLQGRDVVRRRRPNSSSFVRGPRLCAAGWRNRFTGTTACRQEDQIWIDFQDRSLAEHDGTLNHVLELADVSRPLVGTEMLHRLRRHGTDLLPEVPGEAREEEYDQLRDVRATLAKRRDLDRKHVQPVEEVGPEAPRPYRFLEIAIRRRDHPHVHPGRPARPHGFELLLLENAKKLHLRLEGQLTDLVEEDRAAIGELEAADAALQGTGEGTLHMPEQLALDQARGDCAAVHLHQRAVAAGAAVVNGAGDQLLAGSGLAEDEHAGIRRRHLLDLAERGAQGRARPDELLERMLAANLLLQIDVLTYESVAQIAHFFVRQAVVQGDGHGAPDLLEQLASKLVE